MGTIIPRKRKSGAPSYLARVTVKRGGKIVHQEHKTFERRAVAATWIARRETELKAPGAIERAHAQAENVTLADAIRKLEETTKKPFGRTKAQVLSTIRRNHIATMRCEKIGSQDIVQLAQELGDAGRSPATVLNYLSHLAPVFAIARAAWHYPLDPQAMDDAFVIARRLGLTGKARERDRRPTLDELDRLMTYFRQRSHRRPSALPMHRVVAFAIFSTRRMEEITRITWADFQPEHSRVLVRDMKDPEDKIGNHVWCDLTEPAVRIAQAMPRTADRIFPFSTDAISAAFTRAVAFLEIDDLHFHDLRHDGISRLFEMGSTIPKAASVSGHRSWASLKRYTHIREDGDRYAGWSWLPIVCESSDAGGPSTASATARFRSSERSTVASGV